MAAIPCPIALAKAAKKPPAVTINADMTVTTADHPTADHDDAHTTTNATSSSSSSSSSDVVNTVSKGSGSSKQLFHTVLVIAPVNTLENWQEEYARYMHTVPYIYAVCTVYSTYDTLFSLFMHLYHYISLISFTSPCS